MVGRDGNRGALLIGLALSGPVLIGAKPRGCGYTTEDRYHLVHKRTGFEPQFIVDVGANRGNWTQMISAVWPKARKLMVEGNGDHAPALRASGHEFKIALLGDVRREVTYHKAPVTANAGRLAYTDTGNSIFLETRKSTEGKFSLKETRTLETLDELLEGLERPQFPDLLKLDVQGAELLILRGAPRTLRAASLVQLELSVFQYNRGAPLWSEVQRFMDDAGYQPVDILAMSHASRLAPLKSPITQLDVLFVNRTTNFQHSMVAGLGNH
eukprot:CAMPEP_0206062250 /NCGR_PEP_ID=MMETSP1466-20131121/56493_1 /ASSEMBLY_ACC=CAM_ASM_001126 /TAXON_ID=44452 /ORGANISM="Pavlova gyrans, Strain CCMP608" /LENGTH=268 /DNA_ID=CAMNT_0053437609 /DNA_START=48 /DNA_END=854 /DNA_ORIENTATION=-